MDLIGKTTISPISFYSCKILGYSTWIIQLLLIMGVNIIDRISYGYNDYLSFVILFVGLVFVVFSLINLGSSTRFALPTEKTVFKTIGRSMLSKDTLKTIKRIFKFVTKNMIYNNFTPSRKGAVKALQLFKGDCSEYTDLFVALCRSCNIPSMAVHGYFLNFSSTPRHAWAEVYCGRYGWVRFDPTSKDLNYHVNKYIQLYTGRNFDNISDLSYFRYNYWGDPISFSEDIVFCEKSKN